jgi:polyhydroxyalkanoate synthesis regulator phasin
MLNTLKEMLNDLIEEKRMTMYCEEKEKYEKLEKQVSALENAIRILEE